MNRIFFGILIVLGVLLPSLRLKPAQAQAGIVWNTLFYNNLDFSGAPVHTRQDTDISFNWGTGSPVPGIVSEDTFSAHFTSNVYFQAGNYRFTVLADDSVQLYVDGNLVLDTFGQGLHGQTLAADVYLSTGNHALQLDFRESNREAFLYLEWNLGGGGGAPAAGLWYAHYFSNTTLSGGAEYTATEPSPTHYWGRNAPYFSIPADNWSARWSSNQNLSAGTYQISVRADDGVRVYVNGVAYIDEWHGATGQTYSVTLALNAGLYNFVVELYEGQGLAFIEYNLEEVVSTPTPPPTTDAAVQITAYALRVRDEPSTVTGEILTHVQSGEVYPIVGRSADGIWWHINVFGTIGWVHGNHVNVINDDQLPNIPPTTPPGSVSGEVTAFWLNMRAGPSISYNVLTTLSRGTGVEVLGRDLDGSWLFVRTGNATGWVSSSYVDLQAGIDITQLSVQS